MTCPLCFDISPASFMHVHAVELALLKLQYTMSHALMNSNSLRCVNAAVPLWLFTCLLALPALQGFLWQPLSLAWMSADPHYLAHATAAILLGAAVIWPTLYGTQVTQATRVAARAAARLLFLATSYMSVTTPYGLLQFHLPAVMASQGRWVLFACMAWVQGALLQVSPPLQLMEGREREPWSCM